MLSPWASANLAKVYRYRLRHRLGRFHEQGSGRIQLLSTLRHAGRYLINTLLGAGLDARLDKGRGVLARRR